eukprot:298288-Pyramimonas_sp.AAC.1
MSPWIGRKCCLKLCRRPPYRDVMVSLHLACDSHPPGRRRSLPAVVFVFGPIHFLKRTMDYKMAARLPDWSACKTLVAIARRNRRRRTRNVQGGK